MDVSEVAGYEVATSIEDSPLRLTAGMVPANASMACVQVDNYAVPMTFIITSLLAGSKTCHATQTSECSNLKAAYIERVNFVKSFVKQSCTAIALKFFAVDIFLAMLLNGVNNLEKWKYFNKAYMKHSHISKFCFWSS